MPKLQALRAHCNLVNIIIVYLWAYTAIHPIFGEKKNHFKINQWLKSLKKKKKYICRVPEVIKNLEKSWKFKNFFPGLEKLWKIEKYHKGHGKVMENDFSVFFPIL